MTDDITEQKNEQTQEADNTKEQETVENSGNDIQEKIKISDLMENHGVTVEDFQAVYEKNPEIIYALGGGETCKKLANSADRVVTKRRRGIPLTGHCLPGVRNIYSQASIDSLSCDIAREAMIKSRMPYQKTNGGGNGYIALEASGDYLTIKIENKAYNKPKNSPENKEMNDIVKDVNPGITVTVDSISDRMVRAKTGNNVGGTYGHIAVKRNDGCWGCDFKQETINFARYGEYARICIPKDAEISSEYANMLIEEANERSHDSHIRYSTENLNFKIPDIKDMIPAEVMINWRNNALNSDAKLQQILQLKDISSNETKTNPQQEQMTPEAKNTAKPEPQPEKVTKVKKQKEKPAEEKNTSKQPPTSQIIPSIMRFIKTR